MNHPAVVKAAKAIWNDADPFDLPTQEGVPVLAAIIERETKYSRLVEAAKKLGDMVEAIQSDEELRPSNPCEPLDELRSVLAEIKEG